MKVNTVVIPVAGLGTRFLSATKAVPKEMLPIVDTPVIEHIINEAYDAGIEHAVFITARDKSAISNHFDSHLRLEQQLEERGQTEELEKVRRVTDLMNYSFVRQSQLLGVGHAILQARQIVGEQPFAVAFSDDLIKSKRPCIGQLIDVFEEKKSSVVALEPVPLDEVQHFGIIKGKRVDQRIYELEEVMEKPGQSQAPSNLGIIGRYVLTPEIFDELEQTKPDSQGMIQLTDAMEALLSRQNMFGYIFEGKRYDTGSLQGFLKATVDYALERRDLAGDFLEYLHDKLDQK
jgi:UTP--glucose-1-phosphate uridylyltransferase